jgi:DNA-binding NarL/FixJ family response regulator
VVLRVLIVDDHVPFREACRSILRGSEQLQLVGEAGTAAEALKLAQELGPDLVLLDIDLGGESGIEVARQIAEQAGPSAPYVILISAYPADDFADIVDESPALGFIPKSDLSAEAIGALLQRRDGQRESK